MDQATSTPPAGARIVAPPSRRSHRALILFAVLGCIVALSSGGLYVYRNQAVAPSPSAVARSSPEDAVRAFLTAVFLENDARRLVGVVCGSWDPQSALTRTWSQISGGGTDISWSNIRVINSDEARASVSARVGVRVNGEIQASAVAQWRFAVEQDHGWRVCEAQPFLA